MCLNVFETLYDKHVYQVIINTQLDDEERNQIKAQ